jgi:hypothetical protein
MHLRCGWPEIILTSHLLVTLMMLWHTAAAGKMVGLHNSLKERFAKCGLELHPTKTRIVYCKDDD